ncbi:uncharacterized protein LOC129193827 isoform X2 [Dunckerocampus dactyliophorus]|uniref:uncharacterized protein LOC129193827 isoform X2 n=1 Tax=Dunckerocampus dactyliophorus TaxID=161453 RepID=UPI0024071F58|nr:uncharacterized protein LOC129193827 isoform X2 [Dunckerocampus dactyliophorus]
MTGQPRQVPVTDHQVLVAAHFAVSEFNRVNPEEHFFYRILNITSAKVQVVAGLKYFLVVQLDRIVICRTNTTQACPYHFLIKWPHLPLHPVKKAVLTRRRRRRRRRGRIPLPQSLSPSAQPTRIHPLFLALCSPLMRPRQLLQVSHPLPPHGCSEKCAVNGEQPRWNVARQPGMPPLNVCEGVKRLRG